jgi:hypothetical protein
MSHYEEPYVMATAYDGHVNIHFKEQRKLGYMRLCTHDAANLVGQLLTAHAEAMRQIREATEWEFSDDNANRTIA